MIGKLVEVRIDEAKWQLFIKWQLCKGKVAENGGFNKCIIKMTSYRKQSG